MKAASILLRTAMVTSLSFMLVSYGVKTPSKAISNYFDEVKKGDKNSDLLKIKSDTAIVQMGESQEEMSDAVKKLLLQSLKQINYTINSENIDGERAIVNVTVKGPNITNGMVSTIEESFKMILEKSNINSAMSEEEGKKIVDDIMIEKFKKLEIDERTSDVMLFKNENRWIVEDNEDLCNLILGKSKECC